jgi:hypothetical protein
VKRISKLKEKRARPHPAKKALVPTVCRESFIYLFFFGGGGSRF